ncbi:site-specific integrase [Sutcliffiella horikoshii]|uniref:site-specific integrase n=1 Tax=Sutcliffiella horikoshii TaxID=79883 RepID=UPI001CFC7872|nr:site-specific integrase [Sutcliffiella horikoshii]
MSNIKKDKQTGRYFFVLDAGKDQITGKRKQLRRRGFATRREAQIALANLQLQLNQSKETNFHKAKFNVILNQWFEAKTIKLKPSTRKNYEEQIYYNILPYLGDRKMDEISGTVLQNFINALHKDRGLAAATIRTTYGIVSEVLYKASRKGIINGEILDDVVLPRESSKCRVWTSEQIEAFLKAPSQILNLTRHFIGFNISVQTGMRMGEVLGLTWDNIDFENQIITVSQTLSKIETGDEYGLVDGGKTKSAIRTIYISDSLVESLKEHKHLIEKERDIQGSGYSKLNLVVCTQNGNWVHPNNFRRAFKATINQLDIPKIRLHDLRHTHATFLLEQKVNPKIIQERLGHKNVNITLNTYSHSLPSMQLEAAHKFDVFS